MIAYSEPYSFTRVMRLIEELQSTGLGDSSKWLAMKVGRLC